MSDLNTRKAVSNVIAALLFMFMASSHVQAIDLVTLDGQNESVDSVKRNSMWTLVMLWSLDCVACEQQKPMIDSFHKNHRKSNAQVVVVATDGDNYKDQVIDFLSDSNYSFDNYLAKTDIFTTQFEQETNAAFLGTPTYLLYAPDGKLAGVHAGLLQRDQLEQIVGPAEQLAVPSADLIR